MPAIDLTSILPTLPKLLTRKDVGTHFGNIISPRYLANLDRIEGAGPITLDVNDVMDKAADVAEDLTENLKNDK